VRGGLKVSEYGIEDAHGNVMTFADEAQVYAALGLQFIPPELRLGLNEIELARKGVIPTLLAVEDIRGDLHAHTDWSDGTRTIEQMAIAARERGRDYLSISDHSSGRAMANGLSVERLREQKRAIRKAQKSAPLRLLHSSEVDIRADGSLDFADDVLAEERGKHEPVEGRVDRSKGCSAVLGVVQLKTLAGRRERAVPGPERRLATHSSAS